MWRPILIVILVILLIPSVILMRQVEELKVRLQQLGQAVDRLSGTSLGPAVAAEVSTDSPAPKQTERETDTQTEEAAATAASQAAPK